MRGGLRRVCRVVRLGSIRIVRTLLTLSHDPGTYRGFQQLAVVHEREKDHGEAIWLFREAMAQGWGSEREKCSVRFRELIRLKDRDERSHCP